MTAARGKPRGGGNFELYAWLFMRVSGLVLLVIAVFHLMYMHVVIGVDNIDYDVIAQRWQHMGWRAFDLALLVFALAHGTNGARTVLDDYVPRGGWNTGLKWLLYVAASVLVLLGAQIILTFPFAG